MRISKIILLLIVGCSTVEKPSEIPVKIDPIPEVVNPVEEVINPPLVTSSKDILDIVENSSCKSEHFKNRGYGPKSYFQGLALSFHQAKCLGDVIPKGKYDVMENYGIEGSLENIYTLLVGMGMIESSGEYCTGTDLSSTRPDKISSLTSEAGLFQTSFNSISDDASLKPFYENYNRDCFLEVYSKGVTCKAKDWKNNGTGPQGLAFQDRLKKCPSLAADYAARHIRIARSHYYPFVKGRTIAEFKSSCKAMFEEIGNLGCGK